MYVYFIDKSSLKELLTISMIQPIVLALKSLKNNILKIYQILVSEFINAFRKLLGCFLQSGISHIFFMIRIIMVEFHIAKQNDATCKI